jgi:hypothetical protein
MTATTSNIGKLDSNLAAIKLWKKDLKDDKAPEDIEGVFSWMQSQLLYNVAALLEGHSKAVEEELSEVSEILADQGNALDELIDREGDYLQPEMASDLTATLVLGMFIADTISQEKIVLEDELKNKKLQDAMKLYRENTTILLEQIQAITADDEDEDEEQTDADTTDDGDIAPIIHGESGDPEIHDGGGEGASQDEPGGGPGGDSDTNTGTGGA